MSNQTYMIDFSAILVYRIVFAAIALAFMLVSSNQSFAIAYYISNVVMWAIIIVASPDIVRTIYLRIKRLREDTEG